MHEDQFTINPQMLAHPGKRYQGQFIDGLITLVLFALCMYLIKALSLQSVVTDIIVLLVPALYFVLSDALPGGQSLGKRLLGMYVVSKSTGKPCTVIQSVARNVLTPILGVIDAIMILGSSRQRLGDLMANTVVLKNN